MLSFREAQRLDPECVKCWWGEALAWGPNINLPMDSAAGVAAHEAVREAPERIAEAEGRYDDAVAHLREGVRREDALLYGEPPEWTVPVRQELGEVLLAAGRPAEAERAFREVLDRFSDNGWSLFGLARALEARGKTSEAQDVRERFRKAWREADVAPGELF